MTAGSAQELAGNHFIRLRALARTRRQIATLRQYDTAMQRSEATRHVGMGAATSKDQEQGPDPRTTQDPEQSKPQRQE